MTDNLEKAVVVFGVGSIGERHIRNLWTIGFRNIVVFRQRNLPFRDIADAKVTVIKTWEELDQINPFAAIITSPTSQHIQQTLKCVQRGIHVLVEKPLSHTLDEIELLEKALNTSNVYIHVGYMNRFHPHISSIKQVIKEKAYGNLLSVHSKWAEYLPDWHPWEDYRESYASRKELGGGVALTLSHDIDMACYLANDEIEVYHAIKNYRSQLEINVEAGADFLIKFRNGVTANIHLNYYEKVKERFLKLVFDHASLQFDFFTSTLTIKTPEGNSQSVLESFDRNDLFTDQSKFFFQKIQDGFQPEDSIKQIKDSYHIIKMCSDEQ
jgi:predicted dehydrogenase